MPIYPTHMGVELKTRNQRIRAQNLLNAFRRQGIMKDEVYIGPYVNCCVKSQRLVTPAMWLVS